MTRNVIHGWFLLIFVLAFATGCGGDSTSIGPSIQETGKVFFLTDKGEINISARVLNGNIVFTGKTDSEGKLENVLLYVGVYEFQGIDQSGAMQKYKYLIEKGNNTITFTFK
jgi:hypothetical protein